MKAKSSSNHKGHIEFTTAETEQIQQINTLVGNVFDRNFEIGRLVGELVASNGGTQHGEATLERLGQHPDLQCSGEHLRKCWRTYQLLERYGERLRQAAQTRKCGHYYEIARLLDIPDPVMREQAVFAMAAQSETNKLTADSLAKHVTNHLQRLGLTAAKNPPQLGGKARKTSNEKSQMTLLNDSSTAAYEAVEMVVRNETPICEISKAQRACNRLGFAYCVLAQKLAKTGEPDTLDAIRNIIKSLTAIVETAPPDNTGPGSPQPAEDDGTVCGTENPPPDEAKVEFPQALEIQPDGATVEFPQPLEIARQQIGGVAQPSMADIAGRIDWPENSELKVVLSLPVLQRAIRRAHRAAIPANNRSVEDLRLENCIRISAKNGAITVESSQSQSQFSARHVIAADGEDALIIADGEACVSVKALQVYLKKIGDAQAISLTLLPAIQKESVAVEVAVPVKKSRKEKKVQVPPFGRLEVGFISIRGSLITSMDTISPVGFGDLGFPDIADLDVIFTGKASCLRKPYADISFSANPDDPNEFFNKLAIFMSSEGVYFLAADGRRCAIVKSTAEKFDSYACVDATLPILIELKYLTETLASLSYNDPITLAVSRDRSHAYILSGATSYRIALKGEQTRTNFPTIYKIIGMEFGASVLVDRKELLTACNMLYNVSNDRCTLSYQEKEILISAHSLMALKKAAGSVDFEWNSEARLKGTDFCFNTGNLIDGLNKMSEEKVKLTFTPDERKVKMENESDTNLSYYLQVIPPPPPPPSFIPQTETPAESLAALPCCLVVEGAGRE
jgi:DNA polymerase III sliding clamp (beta) subunit (PCNA family)